MAMRELVTGGAACAVPGSSSSANPFGALANALIGSSSKTQVSSSPSSLFSISVSLLRFEFSILNFIISGLYGVVFSCFCTIHAQERLKEIPQSTPTASEPQFYPDAHGHLQQLPGSEFEQPFMQPGTQVLAIEALIFFHCLHV